MKYKNVSTSDGKVIHIYDEVFSEFEKTFHEKFCFESNFRLSWQSFLLPYFRCNLSEEDVKNFRFFDNENIVNIIKNHVGENVKVIASWIIVTTPSLIPYNFHHDATDDDKDNQKIILYYVNNEWNRNWHGQTLYANDNGECEIAVEYKPGRITVYDAKTCHASGPITSPTSKPKFIFAMHLESQS